MGAGRRNFFSVPDRKRQTLISIILKHVKPDTKIMSDRWASYYVLDKLDKNYNHHMINHERGFVEDDEPGVCMHYQYVVLM